MNKETQQQIQDPETEAKELEHALHDMSKAIRESNKRPGKSGLSYSEFKAHFLATIAETPEPVYGSH